MRDTSQLRNYRGLKLASWLTEGVYWKDTKTENQVMNLIERCLNHPEVHARWPQLEEVSVNFPKRTGFAWAERKRNGKGEMSFPPGTLSPLIVLHEFAHLLPTSRREPDHGPGFTAIHLMLIELLYPQGLRAMLAAYHATGQSYDFSRLPSPSTPSKYIPVVSGAQFNDSLNSMKALLTSGVLSRREKEKLQSVIVEASKKPHRDDEPPLMPLPNEVHIPTEALLKCLTSDDIAKAVLHELRKEMLPTHMRGKKIPEPKKKKRRI